MLPGGNTASYSTKLLAVDPAGERLWTMTPSGLTTLQFELDPLSVGEVRLAGTQLTILGSGFSPQFALTIDGVAVVPNVVGTTSLTATIPSLSSGSHALVLTDVGGRTYTLGNAFTTP